MSQVTLLIKDDEESGEWVNLTHLIEAKTFPKTFKESLKGEGYFSYTVEPFTIKLITGGGLVCYAEDDFVTLRRLLPAKLLLDGVCYLNGFIDEIKGEWGETPSITIYPNALLLSDTLLGTKTNLNNDDWVEGDPVTADDEVVQDFVTEGTDDVLSIVQAICDEMTERSGTAFTVDDQSCPVPTEEENLQHSYFGSLLKEVKLGNWLVTALEWLYHLHFPNSMGFTDGVSIRKKDGVNHLIVKDFGFYDRVLWERGRWIDVHLQIPSEDHYIPSHDLNFSINTWFYSNTWTIIPAGAVLAIDAGSWLNWTMRAPNEEVTLPCIGTRIYTYIMEDGGLTPLGDHEKSLFPILDPHPNSTEMNEMYGDVTTEKSMTNITGGQIKAFLISEGYRGDSYTLLNSFDFDNNDSYVMVKAYKKWNDWNGSILLLSFEKPFDFSYQLHYRDSHASDILKDLCVVTNRYLYVDADNKIWLLPRNQSVGQKTVVRTNVISHERTRMKEQDVSVEVKLYETDDKGKVTSYGIRLRPNEWQAIQQYYRDLFQGERIESEMEWLEIDYDQVTLMSEALVDDNTYGTVIERELNFLEPLMKIKSEMKDV